MHRQRASGAGGGGGGGKAGFITLPVPYVLFYGYICFLSLFLLSVIIGIIMNASSLSSLPIVSL